MPTRDERGVAFPSPVVMLSIVAVAMAGIAFVATDRPGGEQELQTVSRPEPAPTATAPEPVVRPTEPKKPKKTRQPVAIKRAEVYVEVYNNSGIAGLAGRTATEAADAGWKVVGSDNWFGTIPASTVYYPERLEPAAKLLAKDLGIARLNPAVAPMRLDRLTVILTGP
ncbi:LytR C-terminal domain-containing protein [Nocardioides donggukensis]|uniref:LytR C-terminal domain-containing protein n=1 Tax=Nocardioides donggukensis TaxID=2774019 RepID=A0A927K1X6_9ACTN|nr:LytR C-terminal domain-containing protein [Nocardioides donggukensis]MBD8868399.1 LytR C-terminal domain-containing protein [Nocardioides donggukensis]